MAQSGRQQRIPGVFDQAFLTDVEGVTEVIMVRHAQPDINFEGIVGDQIDPPLTEHGRMQARLTGEAFSVKPIDAIFASPLKRAMETAEAIAHHHKSLELQIIDDLREVEVFRDVPPDKTAIEYVGRELLLAARQRMLDERTWDVYPYTEPSFDFRKRTINAVESCIARNEGERIVIVCHGGVINSYMGHIIRSDYDMFFRPAHASVNIAVAGDGRRVLRLINDTHHLTTAEGDHATY
ncbi:MAG TPA: histidine phosphatase family protein [Dehalococcoidia bacterium]